MSVTPQERLALGVVALLLAAGAGARVLRPAPAPVAWSASAGEDAAAGARLRSATADSVKRNEHRARPLAAGERLDPNTAPADELQRLPRVGPALAERIVAWRASHGPFRSLAGIAPHLALPAAPAVAKSMRSQAALDLNTASVAELDALPGIGPALAARVVAWRAEKGRFRSMNDLEAVPGIGPALVGRLRGRAVATP